MVINNRMIEEIGPKDNKSRLANIPKRSTFLVEVVSKRRQGYADDDPATG